MPFPDSAHRVIFESAALGHSLVGIELLQGAFSIEGCEGVRWCAWKPVLSRILGLLWESLGGFVDLSRWLFSEPLSLMHVSTN